MRSFLGKLSCEIILESREFIYLGKLARKIVSRKLSRKTLGKLYRITLVENCLGKVLCIPLLENSLERLSWQIKSREEKMAFHHPPPLNDPPAPWVPSCKGSRCFSSFPLCSSSVAESMCFWSLKPSVNRV